MRAPTCTCTTTTYVPSNNELTKADLIQVGDDEPRIPDRRVVERLGFSKVADIRKLIKRNEAELLTYGDLRHDGVNSTTGPGRPSLGFLLNKWQILTISMKSDAVNALAIRKEVITVHQAWRRGAVAHSAAAAPWPTWRRWSGGWRLGSRRGRRRSRSSRKLQPGAAMIGYPKPCNASPW